MENSNAAGLSGEEEGTGALFTEGQSSPEQHHQEEDERRRPELLDDLAQRQQQQDGQSTSQQQSEAQQQEEDVGEQRQQHNLEHAQEMQQLQQQHASVDGQRQTSRKEEDRTSGGPQSGDASSSNDADEAESSGSCSSMGGKRQSEQTDNQSRKLFVGGLSRLTTTDSLRTYFQQYGDVEDSEVLFDKLTGRSRGFGFITFASSDPVGRVAEMRHSVDGTQVEVRRAIPREEARDHGTGGNDKDASRLFVGGISDDVNDEALRTYFRHYGEVQSANVMFDRQNNRSRGFGFVIFRNAEDAEKAIGPHKKLGVHCEAKRAQPRQMNRSERGMGGMWGAGPYGAGSAGPLPFSGGYMRGRGGPDAVYGGGMRGSRGMDYDAYGPAHVDVPGGYGMGAAAGMYGTGGYGGYAANYNPYYAAYYAQMAAYSAMGGYGGYGGATGGAGGYGAEDGYGGSSGVDRGGRMANRSAPY